MSFEVSNVEPLLNDFIRSRQHIRRNRQADLLGGFEIDHELKLLRLLHWKIGGLGAFQDFVHVICFPPRLFQPFLLQPVLLFPFDFLSVLSKGLPSNTGLSRRSNLVTEALHLPVIKAIQNLESKIDPPGGKVF